MKSPDELFQDEVTRNIASLRADRRLAETSRRWIDESAPGKYTYNFRWLGRPIIQLPQDIVAMQELIFKVKPDLIVETGIAHGGSLILSASLLELNAICGGPQDAMVLGVDVDIRQHNRQAIEAHPLSTRIAMIQGSSIAPEVVTEVASRAATRRTVMVCLDSNHTHEHVRSELTAYSPLVTKGSYLVVFDTVVEDMAADAFPGRPWGRGNNPKTAVREFLRGNRRFEIDHEVDGKLLLTVAPDGYLRCVED